MDQEKKEGEEKRETRKCYTGTVKGKPYACNEFTREENNNK